MPINVRMVHEWRVLVRRAIAKALVGFEGFIEPAVFWRERGDDVVAAFERLTVSPWSPPAAPGARPEQLDLEAWLTGR